MDARTQMQLIFWFAIVTKSYKMSFFFKVLIQQKGNAMVTLVFKNWNFYKAELLNTFDE